MADPSLTLPEQVLLLVLKDREGSLLRTTDFRFALAGALLTELLLRGRIELGVGSSGPLVTVVDETPTDDPALDRALEELVAASRRTSPERWVGHLADIQGLRLRVARQLCRKGALKEHEGRVLLVFRRTVYIDLESKVEARVTDRVREGIFGDADLDRQTALLVALARTGNILRAVFGAEEVLERQERIIGVLDHIAPRGASGADSAEASGAEEGSGEPAEADDDGPASASDSGLADAARALVTATELAVMEATAAAAPAKS